MRKATKKARRKKREKAIAKMQWYSTFSTQYYKAKRMYESTLKQRHPYTTSNF